MVKRKMLVADGGLANELVQIAKVRGQTLFSLLNEILEQAVGVYKTGLTLKQVLDEWKHVKAVREAGFVHVVKTLWLDVVDVAFASGNRRSLLERWRETGCWYGKYFAAKNPDDPIRGFKDFICNLMWDASEFVMEVGDGEVQVRCISADFPESYTELLSVFLEGALEVLGYHCAERNVSKGLIRILFKKR